MKEEASVGPNGARCCTWKVIFTLVSVQVLVLLIYQGHFSGVLVAMPTKSWAKLNLSLHQFGVNEWIFPATGNVQTNVISNNANTHHHPVFRNSSKVSQTNHSATVKSTNIDIHEEDPKLGHTFSDKHPGEKHVHVVPNSIAMGLAITSKRLKWATIQQLLTSFPFFKSLLPSFCKTVSKGYSYNFFLAYDHDDPFFNDFNQLNIFQTNVYDFIRNHCTNESNYSLHFVQCSHHKEPARAQNDAMMAGYLSNMEYYYRVNDDTRMKTTGWTEKFIETLKSYNPPLVGVVGPKHRGGNTAILTYDFVHYTHIHIHGFYYPRPLTDWYADTWITEMYRPDRCRKLSSVLLDHTMENGQRYSVKGRSKASIKKLINKGKDAVTQYTTMMGQNQNLTADGERVIAMSLVGRNPQATYGAIRNAQLLPLYFPTWRLRVYLLKQSPGINEDLLVPRPVVDKLILLGVQVVFLEPEFARIDPELWKYQVADDSSVKMFLVRDPRGRFSARDSFVTGAWLERKKYPFFCIRDKKEHKDRSLLPGLFGAKVSNFSEILQPTVVYNLLNSGSTISSEDNFLKQMIWPKVKNEIGCFDTVVNGKWSESMNITLDNNLQNLAQVGTLFNEFEEEIK